MVQFLVIRLLAGLKWSCRELELTLHSLQHIVLCAEDTTPRLNSLILVCCSGLARIEPEVEGQDVLKHSPNLRAELDHIVFESKERQLCVVIYILHAELSFHALKNM
ncbi:hypothetical protein DPMN_058731 [Dreissena polymorpha]|uniref:Uncharacterized protein n=1 Tax=Dreissena polymorpha TaxID=45954 RepID=A0A9D4C2K8_DREPO|nr:hypothetical protein DPMN_058703 [Dreissena polymorpha]KAH3716015.1 hypothetical protein DPMN_058731 [Dreissena polymorpha]